MTNEKKIGIFWLFPIKDMQTPQKFACVSEHFETKNKKFIKKKIFFEKVLEMFSKIIKKNVTFFFSSEFEKKLCIRFRRF